MRRETLVADRDPERDRGEQLELLLSRTVLVFNGSDDVARNRPIITEASVAFSFNREQKGV